MLAFVPLSDEQLARLLANEPLAGPLPAYAPGPRVAEALGYPADWVEETERAVLLFASVAALAREGRRLVAVTEVSRAAAGPDPDSGEIVLDGLAWPAVSALFADDASAATAVTSAGSAARGLELDDAWELPEVASLVSEHDLLWFGPSEAAAVLASS